MSKGVGYGDKLARGGVRANFPATDGGVSKDKWDAAFDDFDPEAFKKNADKERSGDTDGFEGGVSSSDTREARE